MKLYDILKKLSNIFQDIPIISEEAYSNKFIPDYDKTFFLVDPLDGTKEFIKRNGEFTVNIALINKGAPVLGVIYVPVTNVLYFACKKTGSLKLTLNNFNNIDIENLIKIGDILPIIKDRKAYTVVSSRSHVTDETKDFFDIKRKQFDKIKIIPIGSSLKICLVAEGIADSYPRYGPTMEWDIAAGHAIAKYAGKKVLKCSSNHSLRYNKKSLINPWFIVS